MQNIQEKKDCWGLSLWHLLISLFVPSKSPPLYSLKNYSNPVILRRHPEFAAGSESHYRFLLSLTVRFIFRLSHRARKGNGGRAIPLQHLQETFWNLRIDHSQNSSKEGKKDFRSLLPQELSFIWDTKLCPTRLPTVLQFPWQGTDQPHLPTHTHTHTVTTLQKHDRSRLGWFDLGDWLAEFHKPYTILKETSYLLGSFSHYCYLRW